MNRFYIFSFLVVLWGLALILRWFLRERLSTRLQARWLMIWGAVSAFVVAEHEVGGELGSIPGVIFIGVLGVSSLVARWVVPRMRGHVANLVILLGLLSPALVFVYLRSSINVVVYCSLAVLAGVLLYGVFREDTEFDWHFTLTAKPEADS